MKLNYDLIKKNLKTYEGARKHIPLVEQFEKGEVPMSSMRNLGLENFALFYEFMSSQKKINGYDLLMDKITWRKLKPLIIDKTTTERFKKYISNRSKNKFNNILLDETIFDRLLNGRWITKPKIGRAS